jgi:hypothetical protein
MFFSPGGILMLWTWFPQFEYGWCSSGKRRRKIEAYRNISIIIWPTILFWGEQ